MTNQACCSIPPVGQPTAVPENQRDQAAGVNLYVFGNRSAKRGVVLIYDIFGLYPQTKEGAALLAQELNCLVLIPDFFHGKGADLSWVPIDTEDKRHKLGAFFAKEANPERNLATLFSIMKESELLYPTIEKWGALGLCWGGKLAALASGDQTPFAASGQAHPGLLDVADARAMNIPHICLASPDEPADILKPYKDELHSHSELEIYSTMFHGWMGARANLEDEENAKEFNRGYKQVASFLERWL